VAFDVKQDTITTLEENNEDYPGIYIYMDYLRVYPEAGLFSHILGYLGRIDSDELDRYKEFGYTVEDIVGKTGIEKAFELQLNGEQGQTVAEIGANGRRVGTVSETPPVPGDKIILTVDEDFQEKCYDILEGYLKKILINKLSGASPSEKAYSDRDLLVSMIKSNNISVKAILESEEGSMSFKIREYIEEYSHIAPEDEDYQQKTADYLCDNIDARKIAPSSLLFAMYEQGIITLDDETLSKLRQGRVTVKAVLIEKLQNGEITPQMTNLMPCTGSAVVVSIDTGDVLAAVNYPTFDNNELVNGFNSAYYDKLLKDPTTPMVNRAFQEPRPPGSAFKMVTGLAGLEAGVITTKSTIFDKGIFTDAGLPYAKCRPSTGVGGYHGSITVVDALRVSCNYFFYETAYRLGNTKLGTKLEGIAKFNQMMINFGLNDRTGVEIGELYDNYPDDVLKVSSPSLKDYMETMYNPNASESTRTWVDGDTVRTAIGQGYNNYTCASMAKYIATLAANGARYQLHLMGRLESEDGLTDIEFKPNLELQVDLKPENIAAIQTGMRQVTSAAGGTARLAFSGFPISVAGKTGTAQQDADFDHTTFGGYAPYEDPQIAVFVMIPYGDTKTLSAPAAQVARDIIGAYFGLGEEAEPAEPENILAR
jgi:cell division protein FtsI/penicillin-binding protein 2